MVLMKCVDDNGTCGLGGFCRQCPNLKGEYMNITYEDLIQWSKDTKDPLVKEGYILAAEKVKELSEYKLKYEDLKNRVLATSWSRMEPYDYSHHEYCNFCDANLTKQKACYDDCVLIGLLKEVNNNNK
jgi:hypothetical protein